jgi:hypothetical protein
LRKKKKETLLKGSRENLDLLLKLVHLLLRSRNGSRRLARIMAVRVMTDARARTALLLLLLLLRLLGVLLEIITIVM